MRQGQQSRRGRNRGGRKPQNSMSRNYESSGPDVKIRGTAMHIAEKYASLARDAMASGDSVAAENYLQHAEHYNRIILAAQAQSIGIDGQPGMNGHGGGRFGPAESFPRDYDGEGEDGEADEYTPQQRGHIERPEQRQFHDRGEQRHYHERPAYNQHQQPQPYLPQNAFSHAQPQLHQVPPGNGAVPYTGENYGNQPDGDRMPRRRRRRPMGDPQGKNFASRNADPATQDVNGGALTGGSDAPSEESSS